MTASLHMIQMVLDRRFQQWVAERKLAPRADDLGYATHSLLREAFGTLAPGPIRLIDRGASGLTLLAYATVTADALRDQARAQCLPEVWEAGAIDRLAAKPMPASWPIGRTFAFEVRVRPTVRQDRNGDRARTREVDAFPATPERPTTRERVYAAWLAHRLKESSGVTFEEADIRLMSFHRVLAHRRGGDRVLRAVEGPDAVVAGELNVADPAAFSALIARGVGRHRAFGYGMVLLRPSGK